MAKYEVWYRYSRQDDWLYDCSFTTEKEAEDYCIGQAVTARCDHKVEKIFVYPEIAPESP